MRLHGESLFVHHAQLSAATGPTCVVLSSRERSAVSVRALEDARRGAVQGPLPTHEDARQGGEGRRRAPSSAFACRARVGDLRMARAPHDHADHRECELERQRCDRRASCSCATCAISRQPILHLAELWRQHRLFRGGATLGELGRASITACCPAPLCHRHAAWLHRPSLENAHRSASRRVCRPRELAALPLAYLFCGMCAAALLSRTRLPPELSNLFRVRLRSRSTPLLRYRSSVAAIGRRTADPSRRCDRVVGALCVDWKSLRS